MQLRGKFGEIFVADLIREIRTQNLSGVLRLNQGKILKAVFFEKGLPVFAISNLKSEQIGEALVRFQMISADQLKEALKFQGASERLGQTLLRLKFITPEKLERGLRQNMSDIICSVFDWTTGEFSFDERARAEHDVKLNVLTADIILEGARRIRDVKFVRDAICDLRRKVRLTSIDELRNQGIRLQPQEAYVLSRADISTSVEDLLKICGLPEDKALRAIYGLVAAGILDIEPLTTARKLSAPAAEDSKELEKVEDDEGSRKKIREEVTRTFNFYSTADHFEVLGVIRKADSEAIKQAYYKLAKKFHPDRYRHIHDGDLTERLDKILLRLSEAYEAIKEEPGRRAYLRTIGSADNQLDDDSGVKAAETVAQAERVPETVSKPCAARTSEAEQAQFNFDRGMGFLQAGDFMNAIGMLREAVRLAPQNIQFRLQLASALTQNARWYAEAEEQFKKIIELDPFNDGYLTKMGVFYQKTNQPEKAREKFEQALEINPGSRSALKLLGREEGDEKGSKKGFFKPEGGSLFSRLLKRH